MSHGPSVSKTLHVEVSLFIKLCRLQVIKHNQTGNLTRVNKATQSRGQDLSQAAEMPLTSATPALSVREINTHQGPEGVNSPEQPQLGPPPTLSAYRPRRLI